MNKLASFLQLDFLMSKPYLTAKSMLVLIAVFVFLGFSTNSSAAVIGMVMMYGTIFETVPKIV